MPASNIIRHHLLEIILWPNGDGTFRKIVNTQARLRELGIYDDWKLTIKMTRSEHLRLHATNYSDETKQKMSESGKKRVWTDAIKKKISYSKLGKKRGQWFNDGIHETLAFECPKGYRHGRLFHQQKKKSS